VLEAVGGYLWLGALMAREPGRYVSAYNFGPHGGTRGVTVEEVVRTILDAWPADRSRLVIEADRSGAEAGLLRLDCSRAEADLGWRATWDLGQTLHRIVEWYRAYYRDPGADVFALTAGQIDAYTAAAKDQGLAWAG
jgi:CDP-glucose 4,6-dehydratase